MTPQSPFWNILLYVEVNVYEFLRCFKMPLKEDEK